jgi:hypothetical protein
MAYTVDPLDPSTPIDSEGMGYGAEEFRLLKQRINDLETALNSADTTLQDNINAEAVTRGNADTTLQGNIDLKLAIASNLTDVENAITSFNNIKQNATETYAGVVEEATLEETITGAADKFPDAYSIRKLVYGSSAQTLFNSANDWTMSGSNGVINIPKSEIKAVIVVTQYNGITNNHIFRQINNSFYNECRLVNFGSDSFVVKGLLRFEVSTSNTTSTTFTIIGKTDTGGVLQANGNSRIYYIIACR